MRSNLIIAAVGDSSLHAHWLSQEPLREFDLMIVYFGSKPGMFETDCDVYLATTGHKWRLTQLAAEALGDRLNQYEAIWCPDEDLLIQTPDINALFRLFKVHQLQLAQPTLTSDSYHSHDITLQDPECLLRYTNFVEIMAPLFSRQAFLTLLPTFSESVSGWGLDMVWPRLLDYAGIALIDAVTMKHTRPVGKGAAYEDFARRGISPLWEKFIVMTKYDVVDDFQCFKRVPRQS